MVEPDPKLSQQFKTNPTIENYLRLRRQHPDAVIEVAAIDALSWVELNHAELDAQGIDSVVAFDALLGDQAAISELCLRLIHFIVEREALEQPGKTPVANGEAVGDGLINALICMLLDCMSWNNELTVPRDLIVLIRHQLGGLNSNIEGNLASRLKRRKALGIAVQQLRNGKQPTYRSVAKELKVSPSSVMRWFDKEDFASAVRAASVPRRLLWYKR